METFSALLALYAGNSTMTHKGQWHRDWIFYMRISKRLNKQSRRRWIDLRRHHIHYDVAVLNYILAQQCDIIVYSCHYFNGGLVKPPSKLEYACVTTADIKPGGLLLIHLLISVQPMESSEPWEARKCKLWMSDNLTKFIGTWTSLNWDKQSTNEKNSHAFIPERKQWYILRLTWEKPRTTRCWFS